MSEQLLSIHCEAGESEEPIAVLFFDIAQRTWNLRTIDPPTPESMSTLRRALVRMAEQFEREGF